MNGARGRRGRRGTLGVAVVGTGRIARAWHLPEWARRADARLVWAVDVDEAAARAAAASWDVAGWTTELATALADPKVDVVDLCTPPGVHAEQTGAALRAGKHVLVEKPAACSLEDVRAMADAADAARAVGTVAMVAENWLYCPGAVRARHLLDGGDLGEPISMAVTLETGAALTRTPRSFLLDPGVHAVNVVRAFLGEPTHVAAFALPHGTSARTGPGCEGDVVASLRFGGERVASLQLSGRAQRQRPGIRRVRLLGTAGMVEFDVFEGWVEWCGPAWAAGGPRHRWHDPAASRGQVEEIDHFVLTIRGEAEPVPSVPDQVRTHRVLEAIRRSAAELTTVRVAV